MNVAMVGRMRNDFAFCCGMLDRHVRKGFLNDLHARFWLKGAPTLDLEKIGGRLFFMNE
jgi:hypothetical protein